MPFWTLGLQYHKNWCGLASRNWYGNLLSALLLSLPYSGLIKDQRFSFLSMNTLNHKTLNPLNVELELVRMAHLGAMTGYLSSGLLCFGIGPRRRRCILRGRRIKTKLASSPMWGFWTVWISFPLGNGLGFTSDDFVGRHVLTQFPNLSSLNLEFGISAALICILGFRNDRVMYTCCVDSYIRVSQWHLHWSLY